MTTPAPGPTTAPAAAVQLAPADRFFVETITLESGAAVDTQVELALEGSAPFPLAQLHYGHLAAPESGRALVFAAYRRRFSREEADAWSTASLVVPDFLALLGEPPAGAALVVHVHEGGLTGVAWDGGSPLPVTVQARAEPEPTEAQREEFIAGLRSASGLRDAPVRMIEGEISAEAEAEGGVVFRIRGAPTARFSLAALESADVRDKVLLDEWRQRRRRDLRLWRVLQAAAVLAAGALAGEAGALGLRGWTAQRRQQGAAQAPEVLRIETAQTLAARIEDLSSRRLRPFEMLGVINERRPPGVRFLRTATTGLHTLEVEAQTPDAADVGRYEAALRTLASLEGVETRDLRTREGLTTFVLAVRFKPDVFSGAGGSP